MSNCSQFPKIRRGEISPRPVGSLVSFCHANLEEPTCVRPRNDSNQPLIKVGIVVVLGTIMAILDTTIVAVALDTLSRRLQGQRLDDPVGDDRLPAGAGGGDPGVGLGRPPHRGQARLHGVARPLRHRSVLCGFAWSATSLIVFRVLQGLGGGMIMPVGQTIMARAAGPHRMGRVMGIIGVPDAARADPRPRHRRAHHVEHVVALDLLRQRPDRHRRPVARPKASSRDSERDRDHRFDLLGFLLLSPGLPLVVYGLSQVGNDGGFAASSVRVSLVAGVGADRALRPALARKALEPLIDMRLFKRPERSRSPRSASSSPAPPSTARCSCCRSTTRSYRGERRGRPDC